MINYGTDWSDIEMVVFMNKSQTQRLQDAESRASEIFNAGDTISTSLFQMDPRRSIAFQQPRPNETVIPNTVRIFPISSDNDTISWQENTEGDQILCYRDGTVYFDWLSHWRKYAKITPESTFATTALATASYTVRWRDLSAHIMASMRFENNEDVVQALNEA
ncbi:hypothetical protein IMSHALPRED_008162 [Imshaugia aleurites]|uniref:Uncharacterized protein n=1 Tax=Imshaugia aleurites TaxID=172621 RepID=A0A8H3IR94_9LECA|nr:hypothetical protein IMSHALPRED_008162 [Imshaugia aleurites]